VASPCDRCVPCLGVCVFAHDQSSRPCPPPTCLTLNPQVSVWFTNARKRIWLPLRTSGSLPGGRAGRSARAGGRDRSRNAARKRGGRAAGGGGDGDGDQGDGDGGALDEGGDAVDRDDGDVGGGGGSGGEGSSDDGGGTRTTGRSGRASKRRRGEVSEEEGWRYTMDEGSDVGGGGGRIAHPVTAGWSARDGLPALTLAPLATAAHRQMMGDIAAATSALEATAPPVASSSPGGGGGSGGHAASHLPPMVLPGVPTLTPADSSGPFTVSRMMGMGVLTAGSGGMISVGPGTGNLTGALGFAMGSGGAGVGSGHAAGGGLWGAAASSLPAAGSPQPPMPLPGGAGTAPGSPSMGPSRSPLPSQASPSPRFGRLAGGGTPSTNTASMLATTSLLAAHLNDAASSPGGASGGGAGGNRLVFPFPLSQVTPDYIRGLLDGVESPVAQARLEALAEAITVNRASLAMQHRHLDLLQQALMDTFNSMRGRALGGASHSSGGGGSEYR